MTNPILTTTDIEPLEIKTHEEYIEAIAKRDELYEETDDIDRVLCHIVSGIEKYEKENYDGNVISRIWNKLKKDK